MKKLIALCLIFIILCVGLIFKVNNKSEAIVIYTSTEDYNMELMQKRLNEKFPEYEIIIEYMSTSNIPSKIIEEKENSECDIVYQLDYSYIDKMISEGVLANISSEYDFSIFEEDTYNEKNKSYLLPTTKSGGAVIINKKVLSDKGIEKPTCYQDLLKPEYKDLLSMPSPKSSSTGYMFYLSLINAWGEDKANAYFDEFSKNVISFTSSGSGPVNALVNREAGVGLGMISQTVDKITAGNDELEILFFEEGAPFSLYGTSVIKGKEKRTEVMEVLDYIYSDYINESCSKFYPEVIFKDKKYDVPNFPQNINYANMENNTIENKEKLLKSWKY